MHIHKSFMGDAMVALSMMIVPSLLWAEGEWSGGLNETISLYGGKVQVSCDADGKVTGIVAKPTGGETLSITGNAMTFAAGAIVTIAADTGSVAGSLARASSCTENH
ncbi:MAG: hypothetical protein IKO72_07860 [Kiritimatiellae bacterium]|nr:hypothetical protein [Kiritimatiellia bacterium]